MGVTIGIFSEDGENSKYVVRSEYTSLMTFLSRGIHEMRSCVLLSCTRIRGSELVGEVSEQFSLK